MGQVSWRAPDELVDRVRTVAEAGGRSMNEFITRVLDAATDPALAESEAAAIRERLAQAGLLAETTPVRDRPSDEEFEAARRAAAGGTLASDLVSEGRG